MNIQALPIGTVIQGHKILERLGEGYTGVVYRAQDIQNNRTVALKSLKTPEKDIDSVTRRFKDEFRKQLIGRAHPNICSVYQFGAFEGHLFFTSEYIKEYNIYVGSRGLSIADKVRFFIQLLEGLDFIHRCGLLHLDIKAENVFLYGDPPSVKIIDFGLSVLTGGEFHIGGTAHYIAPEILKSDRNAIGAYSDLFSTAVLMYYCLTGAYPFVGRWAIKELNDAAKVLETEKTPQPPSKLMEDVPEYLDTIIMRLLAKRPEDRFYPNARAVINALNLHQPEGFGSTAHPELVEEWRGEGVISSYLRPIGNKHIGRIEMQVELKEAISAITNPPAPPFEKGGIKGGVFHLTGHFGLGKTHLLEALKEEAAVSPESVYISTVSFPADELAIDTWAGDLQRELSENKRAVLILADDVHNCDPEGSAGAVIRNIINTANERKKNPRLYEGIKPVMIVMTEEPPAPEGWLQEDGEIDKERYDWAKTAQTGGAISWELKPFNKEELIEYLRSTPALKDKDVSGKWLEYLMWATSGFPADVAAHLEERDAGKLLFSADGSLILPYTIEPNMDEPSINVTSLKWLPLPAKQRLQKQYTKLEPLEREVVNLMAVWNHRGVTRIITEDDIIGFFYSSVIKQTVNNLVEKGMLCHSRGSKRESSELTFTNPFMQSVIYEQMPRQDREAIHDTIADYLKNDKDGILLHKGYGSDKQTAVTAIVRLAQKGVREGGLLKRAIELLKDALAIATPSHLRGEGEGGGGSALNSYIKTLLVEYYTNSGQYNEATAVFEKAIADIEGSFFAGMRTWKIQLYRRVIPALIQQHKFDEAERTITEVSKLIKTPNSPLVIVIKNFTGRLFYERFFVEGKDVEFLNKAKAIFEKTREQEEQIAEFNRSRVQNNEIGKILTMLGKDSEALWTLKENLNRCRKERNILGEVWADIAIADTCLRLKDYGGAEEFAKSALDVAKKTRQGQWVFSAHHMLVNVYHDSERFEEALHECDKCMAGSSLIGGGKISLNQLFVEAGDCHKELGMHKMNAELLNKAGIYFETALTSGVTGFHLMWAHEGVGEISCYNKDFKNALLHLKTAQELLKDIPESLAITHSENISGLLKKIPAPDTDK